MMTPFDDDLLTALRAARPDPGYQPSAASPEARAMLARIVQARHRDPRLARRWWPLAAPGRLPESEQIKPDSIPALQLPARPHPPSDRPRRRESRHWLAWVTALGAAAAVMVVIAGTFLIAHIVSGSGTSPSATGGPPSSSSIPPYYAYAVQGNVHSGIVHGTHNSVSVVARYVTIRATASGKVLRTVSPPAPYNAFESFAGAANGHTFVLAANQYRFTATDNEYYKQDQESPLKFMILRITPSGHTQLSPLSLPGTLTEAQAPTLALSPDGAQLAVAYGGSGKPAVIQVITLATGQMRQWTSPSPAATPVFDGPGAWTPDGRTLAFGQMSIQPSGTIRSTPTQMRLLNTTAPGNSLAAASQLVTPHGAESFPWPFITPDGTKLIGETDQRPAQPGTMTESGALGVYSARTGTLLEVIGRWQQHEQVPGFLGNARETVVWSNASGSRLIVEMPRGNLNEVGILTGDTFTPLAHAALAPLLSAINSGGYQTSGGYVGFAW
jgi:hypothetical protein